MTHELAARQLNCPVGTVRSRLARGRVLLHKRITRRGLVASTATMAAALESSSRAASLPPRIARSLIAVAAQVASESATIRGGIGVSTSVAVLLEGVLNAMRVKAFISLAAALVAVGALAVVVGGSIFPTAGQTGNRSETRVEDENPRLVGPDGRPFASVPAQAVASAVGKTDEFVKIYYIGDLIGEKAPPAFVPTPVTEAPAGAVPPTWVRQLPDVSPVIDLITSTVARGSWVIHDGGAQPATPADDRGHRSGQDGRTKPVGSITPFYLSVSLIIRHTPEVHDEVADLLRKLRRLVEAREKPSANLDPEAEKPVLGEIRVTPQPQSTDPKPVVARPIQGKPLAPSVSDKNLSEIRFEGNATIPAEKIRPKLLSRVGQPLDMQKIDADVKSLMHTNWFSDVQISYKESPPRSGQLILTFAVDEMPVLTHVEFRGRKAISLKELEDTTGLKVKNRADPMRPACAGHILRLYQEKGYHLAEVKLLEGGNPGDTKVVIQIFEGPKVTIGSVNFVGNRFAASDTLRTRIMTRKSIPGHSGKSHRDMLDDDRQKLVEYYQSQGFFQAKVTPRTKAGTNFGELDLTFVIGEGPRFSVRNVTIEGNSKINTNDLKEDLELHSGRPFLQAVRDADKNRMLIKYRKIGCIDTQIAVEPKFTNEPGVVDLVYKIQEGEPYLLGELKIEGDPQTREVMIQPETVQAELLPAEALDRNRIEIYKRRLKALGYPGNHP